MTARRAALAACLAAASCAWWQGHGVEDQRARVLRAARAALMAAAEGVADARGAAHGWWKAKSDDAARRVEERRGGMVEFRAIMAVHDGAYRRTAAALNAARARLVDGERLLNMVEAGAEDWARLKDWAAGALPDFMAAAADLEAAGVAVPGALLRAREAMQEAAR